MSRMGWWPAVLVLGAAVPVSAAEKSAVEETLAREIIGPRQALLDLQDHLEPRVPRVPAVSTAEEWERHARRIRADVLDKVVFRGEARAWRDAKVGVKWFDAVPGGPGYRIRKLRYEALPGLWIPALLYEPEKRAEKTPVALAVNGHDPKGKAAPCKQIRCINLAKRGMLVLNVEFQGNWGTDFPPTSTQP